MACILNLGIKWLEGVCFTFCQFFFPRGNPNFSLDQRFGGFQTLLCVEVNVSHIVKLGNLIQWSQKWPTYVCRYICIPMVVLAKIYISTRPWERYSFHILAKGCGRTSCELFRNGNNVLFPISSPLHEVESQ
jgi:hypothetical protein